MYHYIAWTKKAKVFFSWDLLSANSATMTLTSPCVGFTRRVYWIFQKVLASKASYRRTRFPFDASKPSTHRKKIVASDLQSYDFIAMRRRLRCIVAFDVQIVWCIEGVASYDQSFNFVSTRRNKIVRTGWSLRFWRR